MKYLVLVLSLLFINCGMERRSEIMYIYPSDKSQIISIISDYNSNTRIISPGKIDERPINNYVILDISDITELGDEIGICWKKDGWQIVNHSAKIVEVALDTTKYIVKTEWETDEYGIPNTKKYIQNDCYTFELLEYSKNYPKENGIIERVD